MSKRLCVCFSILLLTIGKAGLVYGQSTVSLNEAIRTSVAEIEAKVTQGTKVAAVNFSSSSAQLSNHVLSEMTIALRRNGKIDAITQAAIEPVLQAMNLQSSGEINDSDFHAIAQKLGCQYIVTGSIEDRGTFYRIRLRSIDMTSSTSQSQSLLSINVQKDSQTAAITGEDSVGSKATNIPSGTKPITTGGGSDFGYGAMNIAMGLGSYLQGDITGGIIVTGGYAVSAGLIIWELAGLKYDDALAGVPGTIGLGLAGATLVFGFVKPFLYSNSSMASVMDNIHITAVSDERRINALKITYTHSF